jgi:hypothetical protein
MPSIQSWLPLTGVTGTAALMASASVAMTPAGGACATAGQYAPTGPAGTSIRLRARIAAGSDGHRVIGSNVAVLDRAG